MIDSVELIHICLYCWRLVFKERNYGVKALSGLKDLNILVTGGAGYIGSHAVLALLDRGCTVTVVDNLVTGFASLVDDRASFYEADIGDQLAMRPIFSERNIDTVLHFAGSISVPESVSDPMKYYENNVVNTIRLLDVAQDAGLKNFIFSSTSAVYGDTDQLPITETQATNPASPYGRTKLIVEGLLADASAAHGFHCGILRYFNVAGADPAGRTGQSTAGAANLIKLATEVVTGQRDQLTIFGTDYPTPDGTGVRDYVHVTDLVNAHVLLLEKLLEGLTYEILNCGYGRGFSVREVVDALNQVTNRDIPTVTAARRPGDVAECYANTDRLRALGWVPKHDSLEEMVKSALDWEQQTSA
jgi:UDP-glucose 4-epimerase